MWEIKVGAIYMYIYTKNVQHISPGYNLTLTPTLPNLDTGMPSKKPIFWLVSVFLHL